MRAGRCVAVWCAVLSAVAAAALAGGCGKERPGASKAGPSERQYDLGAIGVLGRSRLADYSGRHVVLVVAEADYAKLSNALASEKDTVMNDLSFDLGVQKDLDPGDADGVAEYVRGWIHRRYWEGDCGPVRRVELRADREARPPPQKNGRG
jgi:hypothetical protein